MRRIVVATLLAALAWPALAQAQSRTHGVNLSSAPMFYDNAVLVFADLIKGSSTFNWYRGVAPVPAYDAAGWPTRVDAQTGATSLGLALNALLPAGDYTITAKGTGTIQVSGSFTGSNQQGNSTLKFVGDAKPQILKRANPGVPYGSQLVLTVTESSAADPIRDISFVLPGHVGKTFYDGYLADLAPFGVLRTMDWQATNGSKLVNWKDRPTSKFSCSGNGRVSEEVAIELANTLKKDLWICIPALASDDYIAKLAQLLDSTLDPARTIYVEYSNELWNSFPQAAQLVVEMRKVPQFPAEVPSKPGVTAAPLMGAWEYTARRDGRATNLFKASLAADRKCVRVIARQAGYPATITLAMNQYKADGYGFDAISCSGYFYSTANLTAAVTLFKTDQPAAVTAYVAGLAPSLKEFAGYWAFYGKQAEAAKVPFLMYEAGQHLSGAGWAGDDAATTLLMAVNRDPRMGETYLAAMAAMPPNTGAVCWYYDAGVYSKWGYWGLKERTGQAPAKAPKYAAILADIVAHLPPPPPPPPPPPVPDPVPVPVPTLTTPVPAFLAWLKVLGIDGTVKLGTDGAYTATLHDPGPPGYLVRKLVVPPPPVPVPAGP